MSKLATKILAWVQDRDELCAREEAPTWDQPTCSEWQCSDDAAAYMLREVADLIEQGRTHLL